MYFCNCTLAGTKVCETCSNNPNSITKTISYHWADDFFKIFDLQRVETYNPETHELVEKKDAKIKRIKESITKEASRITYSKEKIQLYENEIKTGENEIKKLEQELKELEG